MTALVVYESMFGNTHAIAEEVAAGLRASYDVKVVPASDVTEGDVEQADLVVIGGPTHVHGMASPRTRLSAMGAAERSSLAVEPTATDIGVREVLAVCARVHGVPAAAFDTRLKGWSGFTGRASVGIARRLRRHGFRLVDRPHSFIVDSANHLLRGEKAKARAWGAELAADVVAPPHRPGPEAVEASRARHPSSIH